MNFTKLGIVLCAFALSMQMHASEGETKRQAAAAQPKKLTRESEMFLAAAKKHDLAAMEMWLLRGADVNATETTQAGEQALHGGSAVLYATGSPDDKMVHFLKLKRADFNPRFVVDSPDKSFAGTPLLFASACADKNVLAAFIACGADPKSSDKGDGILHVAVLEGNLDGVALGLASGLDINQPNETGMTPLMLAVTQSPQRHHLLEPNNSPALIRLLKYGGARSDLINNKGETAKQQNDRMRFETQQRLDELQQQAENDRYRTRSLHYLFDDISKETSRLHPLKDSLREANLALHRDLTDEELQECAQLMADAHAVLEKQQSRVFKAQENVFDRLKAREFGGMRNRKKTQVEVTMQEAPVQAAGESLGAQFLESAGSAGAPVSNTVSGCIIS